MISRIHSIRRRSAFQLSSNCSGRRVSSSSFSSGLGSRLLKTTEKDPPVNNQPQRSPSTDPPKRVSIFSKPASSTPPANGFMAKIGDMTGAGAPARPRFSISAALQNQNVRRSAGDMWKPIPGTATKLVPAAEAATGLEGASSIRDFARRAAEQAKSDAQDKGPSIRVLGGKGLFTKEEISDMKENFDPSNKPLSSAAAVMADVLNQPEEDADSDDEAPQVMEPTAGEMRYWKFQDAQRIQREQFLSKHAPPNSEGRYTRPSSPVIPVPRSHDMSNPAAASTPYVPIAYVPSSLSTPPPAPTHDENGVRIPILFNIAEMKRLTTERLNMQKMRRTARTGGRPESHLVATVKKKGAAARTIVKEVLIPAEGCTLRELSSRMSMKLLDVKNKLVEMGETVDTHDSSQPVRAKGKQKRGMRARLAAAKGAEGDSFLEADVAELVVLEMGLQPRREAPVEDDENPISPSSLAQNSDGNVEGEAVAEQYLMLPRAPVVCIMGHVDHGKTTLLDALRKSNVAASEAGGITQKLSAFTVNVGDRSVVFVDTPGHAAFSAMRNYGACSTDMVILVVALDDGVRPQTEEALKMALDARCNVIVALNKVDRIPKGPERTAARSRVLSQLLNLNLIPEEYGGTALICEVSARDGDGIDNLVEGILLQADVMELKAARAGQAEATVLDASMDKGKGVVADVLVQWGELCVGDAVVIGTSFGRVKAMKDHLGNKVLSAGPSTPVRLLGLRSMPVAGQELLSVTSEAKARQIAERRERTIALKAARLQIVPVHLNVPNVSSTSQKWTTTTSETNRLLEIENAAKTVGKSADALLEEAPYVPVVVNVIIKADGVGTLNALQHIVTGLASRTTDVVVKVVAAAVGDINLSDVERAGIAGDAIVLGFNVNMGCSKARAFAKENEVKVFREKVIYRLEEQLKAEMERNMPSEKTVTKEGTAKVQQVFNMGGKLKTQSSIAGLIVQTGSMKAGGSSGTFKGSEYIYRVIRPTPEGRIVMGDSLVPSVLKRFKEVVHEVNSGLECGLALTDYGDFQAGDEIECLKVVWKTRVLSLADAASGSILDPLNANKKKPIKSINQS